MTSSGPVETFVPVEEPLLVWRLWCVADPAGADPYLAAGQVWANLRLEHKEGIPVLDAGPLLAPAECLRGRPCKSPPALHSDGSMCGWSATETPRALLSVPVENRNGPLASGPLIPYRSHGAVTAMWVWGRCFLGMSSRVSFIPGRVHAEHGALVAGWLCAPAGDYAEGLSRRYSIPFETVDDDRYAIPLKAVLDHIEEAAVAAIAKLLPDRNRFHGPGGSIRLCP